MGKIERVLKAWRLIDQINESQLPSDIGGNKPIELNEERLRIIENPTYFETLFPKKMSEIEANNEGKNRHEKTDDLVFPVFLGIYKGECLKERLRDSDEKAVEPDETKNFLAMMLFDQDLKALENQIFVPATSLLLKNIDSIEQDVDALQDKLEETYNNLVDSNLSFSEKMGKMNNLLCAECGFTAKDNVFMEPIHQDDLTMLHSFYVDDINEILNDTEHDYGNLERYIEGNPDQQRVNLEAEDKSAYQDILHPLNYPDGRWPSNPKFALSLMQQAAVNLALNDNNDVRTVNGPPGTGKTTLLKDIFADMMVQQASALAKFDDPLDILVRGANFAWEGENPKYHIDWQLDSSLTGFGIVVASSNNSAVENISKELPERDDFFENGIVDYFSTAYAKNNDKPSFEETWGYFSGTGGNSDNVGNLVNGMNDILHEATEFDCQQLPSWHDARQTFKNTLTEIEAIKKKAAIYFEILKPQINIDEAKQELIFLRNEVEEKNVEFIKLKQKQEQIQTKITELTNLIENEKSTLTSGLLGKFNSKNKEIKKRISDFNQDMRKQVAERDKQQSELNALSAKIEQLKLDEKDVHHKIEKATKNQAKAHQIKQQLEVKGVSVLDAEFWKQDNREIQLAKLWFDDDFRELQSRAFQQAMQLRKIAIIEIVQSSDRKNKAFNHVLNYTWRNRKKIKVSNQTEIMQHAWSVMQFLVPVISTTFASFSRFLGTLGYQGVDNLFIDEAGQALPVQAVGGFWRSKRVMAVGDPSQIPPVQTVEPLVLGLIQEKFKLGTNEYTDFEASVQLLADKASQFGALIEEEWGGIPLWVHRRCLNPMFSIANQISYHNKMVQGAGKQTGPASWFDVKGAATKRQYVPAQRDQLEMAIKRRLWIASNNPDDKYAAIDLKDIFVIAPFKIVADEMKKIVIPDGVTKQEFNYWQKNNVGTVHQFQGKEAQVVIFVLGADENTKGSIKWATDLPNLLNVAVTRATKEFYIIGDKELFGNYPNLDVVNHDVKMNPSDDWQKIDVEMVSKR